MKFIESQPLPWSKKERFKMDVRIFGETFFLMCAEIQFTRLLLEDPTADCIKNVRKNLRSENILG